MIVAVRRAGLLLAIIGENGMKFIPILLAVFQFSLHLGLNPSSNFYEANAIASEEYAVYSALIQTIYVKEDVKTIVIGKHTLFYKVNWSKPEEYRKSILDELRPISLETIEDLEKKKRGDRETRSLSELFPRLSFSPSPCLAPYSAVTAP